MNRRHFIKNLAGLAGLTLLPVSIKKSQATKIKNILPVPLEGRSSDIIDLNTHRYVRIVYTGHNGTISAHLEAVDKV